MITLDKLKLATKTLGDTSGLDARAVTYLDTYPSLIRLAGSVGETKDVVFRQLCAATYGWMPRVVRIDMNCFEDALLAFQKAQAAQNSDDALEIVEAISECLHSVVGASKLMHFANTEIFPMWDSRVARVWTDSEKNYNYMSKSNNYIEYVSQLDAISKEEEFSAFYEEYQMLYGARLEKSGIQTYDISAVRCIESAAFELSVWSYDE